ncbi:uncharacterized protein LOC18422881 isoform X1 [Amborella trichopoda]|uniref:Uncharacterized protein n=2 Tax=Amborella trichopoda TaxID=13333 RepID=W1NHT2_AMBTC|nr:uncharacterized protein LOC18422881 isoform X1 [Amborella trichopoda]XP_020527657.1 uncharacterized protein LOC18422881 isoform X1 [Amborella trichopoda]ERM95053.1 hypothetical protein AMTR_s00009p00246820 [Amborella trichopoda]|eukprot:XP_006827637.1 uncharacterized protein LOC18422881 isoform X1 [Amborella trichopoda]
MAGVKKPSRNGRPSIKYRWDPHSITLTKISDTGNEDNFHLVSGSKSETNECISEPGHPSKILSTSEVVSAFQVIWGFLSEPSSISQPRSNARDSGCGDKRNPYSSIGIQLKHKEDIRDLKKTLPYSFGGIETKASLSADIKDPHTDSNCTSSSPRTLTSDFELLKVLKNKSLFALCTGKKSESFFWSYNAGNMPHGPVEISTMLGLRSIRFSYVSSSPNSFTPENYYVHVKPITSLNESDVQSASINSTSENFKVGDAISSESLESKEKVQHSIGSHSSSDAFGRSLNMVEPISVPGSLEKYNCKKNTSVCKNTKRQFKGELVLETVPLPVLSNSILERANTAHVQQVHAIAGALAGVFVSLWLHPVDTLKTVIQSGRVEQKSIGHILGSIVSERGVTGLYRGIGSNLASSAPISAVYTFTYETIKEHLLPLLPKGYHSLAHCVAGGSASIATSFIFTPSERIKQQMQIGSHYHTCWKAFIGILEKGGVSSLYAGWGAVLCRNIPHSIIKFYTYESLKQWALSRQETGGQLNTLQTLVFGGLAGSTAALFTTPFDVIKTRLQTQIPGSLDHYGGVFHAFQQIAKIEGLRGLYRGLTPRLVMYVSQGALFFASYEFFKRLFSLEVKLLGPHALDSNDETEDQFTEIGSA